MVLLVSQVEVKVAELIRFLADEWGYEVPDAIGPIADAAYEARRADSPVSPGQQVARRNAQDLLDSLEEMDRLKAAGDVQLQRAADLLTHRSRAQALWTLDRRDEAITQLREQRDLLVGIHGPDSPDTIRADMLLAVAIGETEGWSGDALATLGEVLIHQQVVLGPAHDDARRTAAMLESIQLAGERGDRVLTLMAQLSVMGRSMTTRRGSLSDASPPSSVEAQMK